MKPPKKPKFEVPSEVDLKRDWRYACMVLCIPSYMRNTKLHIIKRFAFFLIMEVGLLLLYGARSNQIPCSLLNWNAYFGSLYMSGLHHHCQFSPRIYGFLKLFPFLFVYILCLLLYWNDKIIVFVIFWVLIM